MVQEAEANREIVPIFGEVRAALGIDYSPLFLQTFAGYPKFLEMQWRAMKPLLATREFFEIAARLRAEAYTHVHNYFKVTTLGEGLARSEAAPMLDVFSDVETAALLLLSVQLQAFESVVGQKALTHPADQRRLGATAFEDAETAPAPVRRILEDMRLALELPFCTDEQRALALWPELLFAYWRDLKPALQSIFYENAISQIRESAWLAAEEIPVLVDLEYDRLQENGVTPDEIASVTRLTDMLARAAAATLLNATFAKIGLEGGNREVLVNRDKEERVA